VVSVSDETFKSFKNWSRAYKEVDPQGKLPVLGEKLRLHSVLLPGMSAQTQLLDPGIRQLLVRIIKDKKYEIKNDSEMEERWLQAEHELIQVSGDVNNLMKVSHFYKIVSNLGRQQFLRMKQVYGVKNIQLSTKANDALNFFFMSDKLRERYFNTLRDKGSDLSNVLYMCLRGKDPSFQKTYKNVDDKTLATFSSWMVEEVFSGIMKKKDGRKKIELLIASNKEKKNSSYFSNENELTRKIKQKFNGQINIKISDIADIFSILIEKYK